MLRIVIFLLSLMFALSSVATPTASELRRAIVLDDAAEVARYLEQGGSPNAVDRHNNPIFLLAVFYQRDHLVKQLLTAGADPNLTGSGSMSALMTAISKGQSRLVDILIKAGADVNQPDQTSGQTPLQFAVRKGDPSLVAQLLQQGADPNQQDRSGLSAQQLAQQFGQTAIIALLQQPQPTEVSQPEPEPPPQHQNPQLPKIWRKTYPKLEEVLERQEQHEHLPDHAWFRRDKADNQEAIDALLAQAIELLGLSGTQEQLEQIQTARQQIKRLRQQMSDYRVKKIGDPDKASHYDTKIAQQQEHIVLLETEIASSQQQIAAELRAMGLQIQPEQLEVLLAGVNGNDMVQMSLVFDNVKQFSNELARLMSENKEDLEFARKHYGMYAILIELLIQMQQNFLDAIQRVYLPGIDQITEKTRQLQQKTERLLQFESSDYRRQALERDLASQAFNQKTAALYRQLLKRQEGHVADAQQRLQDDLKVALIRYHTVKLSGELVSLMQANQQQFDALARLQLPDIVPFQNLQMKSEFERLTIELQKMEQSQN